jgi:hypothetical protein
VYFTFLIYAFRQLRTLFRVNKMDNAVDRHVFYISDGTAITAEVLGHAVMSQFPLRLTASRCRLWKMRAAPGR